MPDDWTPGDVALCVDDRWGPEPGSSPLRAGVKYTVASVWPLTAAEGGPALALHEVDHWAKWFDASRFIKQPPLAEPLEHQERIGEDVC